MGRVLGVNQHSKHAVAEPCCSTEGQSCNTRQSFRLQLMAGLLMAQGPLNMQCPVGLDLHEAPLYLKLGHFWGGAGPSIRAVLDAPRLILLAGGPLEIPGEHQAFCLRVALVPVELGEASGEVFKSAAVVVTNNCEVHLSLQAGCGADRYAGALAFDGQVVVLQEDRIPLLVLVLISCVTLWGTRTWWFDFLLRALPQPCSLWPDKTRGMGIRGRERERGQDSECQKKSQGCKDVLKWKSRSGNEKHAPGRFPWNLARNKMKQKLLREGMLLWRVSQGQQSKLASFQRALDRRPPSKARIQKPIRSSTVQKAGMEAWSTGPSVQEALRGKLRKEGRDSEEFRRGGKEAEAGSLRNTEVSSLSIALSLWGEGQHQPGRGEILAPREFSITLNSMATMERKFWPHQCN